MSLYNEYVKWDEEHELESNVHEICAINDRKNNVMLGVKVDNHIWSFGSCYDAEMAAEHWVNQFENVNYRTIFIIVGVGNGTQIGREVSRKLYYCM